MVIKRGSAPGELLGVVWVASGDSVTCVPGEGEGAGVRVGRGVLVGW